MASQSKVAAALPPGIELHGKALRISFFISGKRFKETLGLEPTKQNIKYANGLRETIMHEIRVGTFNYLITTNSQPHEMVYIYRDELGGGLC
ncbi:Arm DNA-binding domain-containing protein, partial [Vibrio alfacsensis]|uniref:Arm DNA-binding domain-containing protein n=1 Tax=Vibrio alfacsensis TaxID=1074311 RepID=UPI004067E338